MVGKRIRIYDPNREHYRFLGRNIHINQIYNKTTKVSKYFTKKIGDKSYLSGRVILPSKFCQTSKIIKQRYSLIRLERTHLLKGQLDLWGYSYLLFIYGFTNHKGKEPVIRVNTKVPYNLGSRKNYSRISKHSRKTNGKEYIAGKIYVPNKLIGKKLYFIRLVPPVQLIREEKSSETKIIEEKKDIGLGYILFYEDPIAKQLKISYKHKRDKFSYEETFDFFRKGKDIWQIAKLRKLKPTSVWNHIAIAYKKGRIPHINLRKIIIELCNKEVKDKVAIFIESLISKQIKKEKRFIIANFNPRRKFKLEMTRKELKKSYYKMFGEYLPINMIEVIALYIENYHRGQD